MSETTLRWLVLAAGIVALSGCELGKPNPDLSSTESAGRVSETALSAHFLRIRKAAGAYRSVNGVYPDTVQQLVDAGNINPGQELDPWGTPFALRVDDSTLIIISYGADKAPGGANENRDRESDGVVLR